MNRLTKAQKSEILQYAFPALLTDFLYAVEMEAIEKRSSGLGGLKSDNENLIKKLYSKLVVKSTTCKNVGEKEVLYNFFNEFLKEAKGISLKNKLNIISGEKIE